MSARLSEWITSAGSEDLLFVENAQLKQLNQEMKKNLDDLQQDMQEAKILVKQTQSKVEKLAASVDKIQEPENNK
ncbi:MAG TPA: hypothetical protein VMH87_09425 [Pseudomonadales bacterium]|nr:hypothetical protein [Pseudomonadales bacterium]